MGKNNVPGRKIMYYRNNVGGLFLEKRDKKWEINSKIPLMFLLIPGFSLFGPLV